MPLYKIPHEGRATAEVFALFRATDGRLVLWLSYENTNDLDETFVIE